MKLLLIDTCGSTGSLALCETAPTPAILGTSSIPGRNASERLLSTLKALLAQHKVPLRSLEAIAVVNGPGSFTGVRVGVSAAKGLAEALNLPVVAISRLAVLAAQVSDSGHILAVLDSGRGEFYAGEYSNGNCLRETILTLEEVVALHGKSKSLVVACEADAAASLVRCSPHLVAEPAAASALPFALSRLSQGEFSDVALLDANYLRPTGAEIVAKSSLKQPDTNS